MKKSQAFASRKLTLNRETLAVLTNDELDGVAGGQDLQKSGDPVIPRTLICGDLTHLCGSLPQSLPLSLPKPKPTPPKPPTTTWFSRPTGPTGPIWK